MAIKRKKYSEQFINEVMKAVNNRMETDESMTAIAKRFNLDRSYLYQIVESVNKKPLKALKKEIYLQEKEIKKVESKPVESKSAEDPRDRMIYQLKILVGDLNLKINELEARLGGYKRYADKRLYSPSRPDSV